jgi:hypothetical protein
MEIEMKTWKVVLGVITVFLLGMLAGGLVTAKVFQRGMAQALGGRPNMAGEIMAWRTARYLRLDATQRQELRAIVREAQQQMWTVREQVHPQVQAVLSNTEQRVRAILRPDQAARFDRLLAERKGRWRHDRGPMRFGRPDQGS